MLSGMICEGLGSSDRMLATKTDFLADLSRSYSMDVEIQTARRAFAPPVFAIRLESLFVITRRDRPESLLLGCSPAPGVKITSASMET